jgi:hypothetical protein
VKRITPRTKLVQFDAGGSFQCFDCDAQWEGSPDTIEAYEALGVHIEETGHRNNGRGNR